MHVESKTPILYFGTPVVLISTLNENDTFNLAPISSAFWLGWRCLIGISASSKTTENLLRTRECVLNLPSVHQVQAVNRLALTTGTNPVPFQKVEKGYRHVADKFELAQLTHEPAQLVSAPKVRECPVQMEARVMAVYPVGEEDEGMRGRIISLELKIVKVYLDTTILLNDNPDKVDPDQWRPLLMSFQQFYGLGERAGISDLAQIPEHLYRMQNGK